MIISRALPQLRTILAYSRCSGVSCVSSSNPVMPMTPFIGVRISWLMLARKSLLAFVAASAASFACNNSVSARLRSLTSWMTAMKCVTVFRLSRTGVTVISSE